jgi:hypothetical protein
MGQVAHLSHVFSVTHQAESALFPPLRSGQLYAESAILVFELGAKGGSRCRLP